MPRIRDRLHRIGWYRRMDLAMEQLIDTNPVLAFVALYVPCALFMLAMKVLLDDGDSGFWFVALGPPFGVVLGRRLRRQEAAGEGRANAQTAGILLLGGGLGVLIGVFALRLITR